MPIKRNHINYLRQTDRDWFKSGFFFYLSDSIPFQQIHNRFRFMLMNYRCKQDRQKKRERETKRQALLLLLNNNNLKWNPFANTTPYEHQYMNNVTRTTYVNATCFLFVFWHIYNAYYDNDGKNKKKKRVNSVVSF